MYLDAPPTEFRDAPPKPQSHLYLVEELAATNYLDDDPFVMISLDIKNAYNTENRQHIHNHMAAGCPINLDSQNNKTWQGWDVLWPIFKAHYETKGILKFYHAGQTEYILSETGTQQD